MTIGERLVQQQKKAEIANADLTAMKLRQQRRLEYMEVRIDSKQYSLGSGYSDPLMHDGLTCIIVPRCLYFSPFKIIT